MVSFNASKNSLRTYVPNGNAKTANGQPLRKVPRQSTTRRTIPNIHAHLHKQAAQHLANAESHYQKAAAVAAILRKSMMMPPRRTAGRFTITSAPSRAMGSTFAANIQKANVHMNRAKNLIHTMNFSNLKNKATHLHATSKRLHTNARRLRNRNRMF